MDDQNKINQPLVSGTTPVVPKAAEDITPVESPTPAPTPITTTTTTTYTEPVVAPTEETVTTPAETMTPPAETAPITPWPSPEPLSTPTPQPEPITTTTTTTTIPSSEPFSAPTPAPEEVSMPAEKPKKKILPIVGGIVALLLVIGVAGAAYYVSNQLSTRQAVAPTAPESEPLAGSRCAADKEGTCGAAAGCLTGERCKVQAAGTSFAGYYCTPDATCTTQPTPTATPSTKTCTVRNCSGSVCVSSTTTVGYTQACPSSSCVDNTSCAAATTPTPTQSCECVTAQTSGCTSGIANVAGTRTCISLGIASRPACGEWGPCTPVVPTATAAPTAAPTTVPTATPTAPVGGTDVCVAYTYIPGATSSQENQLICNPDRSKINTINFTTAGTVRIHLTGASAGTTVALAGTGTGTAVTKVDDNNFDAVVQPGTYTVTIKLGNEATNSLGYINPSGGSCRRYGELRDISLRITPSALSSFGIYTTSGVSSPFQCWADTIQGVDNNTRGQLDANYDFNDFDVVVGYKAATTVVGACVDVKIYKAVNGVYSTTPLTTTQLQSLKVGDLLKFSVTGSLDNLKAQFRVHVNNIPGNWISASSTVAKVSSYSDYLVGSPGSYQFEAQVSTTP